jgi:hypothetical protein
MLETREAGDFSDHGGVENREGGMVCQETGWGARQTSRTSDAAPHVSSGGLGLPKLKPPDVDRFRRGAEIVSD